MQTVYHLNQYHEAKAIIAHAEIVHRYSDPCVRNTLYETPDGNQWQETESLLEYPENDYCLRLVMPAMEWRAGDNPTYAA